MTIQEELKMLKELIQKGGNCVGIINLECNNCFMKVNTVACHSRKLRINLAQERIINLKEQLKKLDYLEHL